MSNLFDVTEQTKQIAEFVKALPPRLLTHDPKSRPVHVPQAVAYYVKPTDEVRAIPCPPWLEEMAAAIRRNDVEVAAALVPLTKPVFSRLAAHVMGDNPPGEFHESTDLLAHIRSVNPKLRISPVSGVKLDIDKDEMDGHALGMFFLPILRLAQT
ncbi:MAG: hypothetical protein KGZ65_02550, partial [Sphingomonadales bacterium]|nr:hypothetical protein [Sphingomonadaceae bacterium]MBS3930085.1 hypothetical protein [Sphingomonadales bacterium]